MVKTDVHGGVLRVSWACSEGHFGCLHKSFVRKMVKIFM